MGVGKDRPGTWLSGTHFSVPVFFVSAARRGQADNRCICRISETEICGTPNLREALSLLEYSHRFGAPQIRSETSICGTLNLWEAFTLFEARLDRTLR